MSRESVPPPTQAGALDESSLGFVRSLSAMLSAEAELSVAATMRAAALGVVAALALAVGWLASALAAGIALSTFVGPLAAACIVAAAHLGVAGLALQRRQYWQKRIGFARTRRALHVAFDPDETP